MAVEGNSILIVWPFHSEHERLKQQRYRTREQCHGPIERHKQSTEIRQLDMGSRVARPLWILGVRLASGRGGSLWRYLMAGEAMAVFYWTGKAVTRLPCRSYD
jgi:hypothetical protein